MFGKVKIRSYERGLVFKDKEFVKIIGPGEYFRLNPLSRKRIEVVSMRDTFFDHDCLDLIVRAKALEDYTVFDLQDNQRVLVWVDGRFEKILPPGLHAVWNTMKDVKVFMADAGTAIFEHGELHRILASSESEKHLDIINIEDGFRGVLYVDGKFSRILNPGRYAFWKKTVKTRVYHVDVRETVLDISGQEIMTKDKVTLRLNAVIAYRVTDAKTYTEISGDSSKSLYREAQLALRSIVGTTDLETLLVNKDSLSKELEVMCGKRADHYGIEVDGVGIRDIILPGEMKALMNRVIEAEKEAQANLISRREETAAMRSQANTAKLLNNNPTLLRLRELEILEKLAENSKLKLVLGEKGVSERVMNLL